MMNVFSVKLIDGPAVETLELITRQYLSGAGTVIAQAYGHMRVELAGDPSDAVHGLGGQTYGTSIWLDTPRRVIDVRLRVDGRVTEVTVTADRQDQLTRWVARGLAETVEHYWHTRVALEGGVP